MPLVEETIFRNKAVVTVFACSVLLHVLGFSSGTYLFQEFYSNTGAIIILVQAIALLVYPFLGWIANVHLTRFFALKCAPFVSAVGATVGVVGLCIVLQQDNPTNRTGPLTYIYHSCGNHIGHSQQEII